MISNLFIQFAETWNHLIDLFFFLQSGWKEIISIEFDFKFMIYESTQEIWQARQYFSLT